MSRSIDTRRPQELIRERPLLVNLYPRVRDLIQEREGLKCRFKRMTRSTLYLTQACATLADQAGLPGQAFRPPC